MYRTASICQLDSKYCASNIVWIKKGCSDLKPSVHPAAASMLSLLLLPAPCFFIPSPFGLLILAGHLEGGRLDKRVIRIPEQTFSERFCQNVSRPGWNLKYPYECPSQTDEYQSKKAGGLNVLPPAARASSIKQWITWQNWLWIKSSQGRVQKPHPQIFCYVGTPTPLTDGNQKKNWQKHLIIDLRDIIIADAEKVLQMLLAGRLQGNAIMFIQSWEKFNPLNHVRLNFSHCPCHLFNSDRSSLL